MILSRDLCLLEVVVHVRLDSDSDFTSV